MFYIIFMTSSKSSYKALDSCKNDYCFTLYRPIITVVVLATRHGNKPSMDVSDTISNIFITYLIGALLAGLNYS